MDTGLKHGTVTVLLKKEGYEVTTFRIDGEYTDHRRPDGVTFTRELSEDLLRRDFTINAMAYSDKTGIVDLYGGIDDLNKGIIRCVGNADDRFDEDALRIMRAVRFAAQLGFEIEEATREAAKKHAPELAKVSAERIETELTKLLVSPHPEKLLDMYELGITKEILPEFDSLVETEQHNPHHRFDVGRHTIEVVKNVPPTKVLRYSALLHDVGKPACKTTDENGVDHFKGHAVVSEKMAGEILRRLKMDNDTIRDVKKLVYWHDYGIQGVTKKSTLRRMLNNMGAQYFESYTVIRRADVKGQSDYMMDKKLEILENTIKLYNEIIEGGDAITIKDLKLTGNDLIQMGIQPGPELGRILKELLDKVLDDPELNTKEKLIELVNH